jgi:hypothetical protein
MRIRMIRRRLGVGVVLCVAALAAYGCGTLIGADEEGTLATAEAGTVPEIDGSSAADGSVPPTCPNPITYYRDGDRDGYGSSAESKLACDQAQAGPDYVTVAGDCDDGDNDIHPGQLSYFAAGFGLADGAVSFDYDCDGQESEKPDAGHFNGCDAAACTGATGYLPASPSRPGAKNTYCGSARRGSCKFEDGQCKSENDSTSTLNPCR